MCQCNFIKIYNVYFICCTHNKSPNVYIITDRHGKKYVIRTEKTERENIS